jgi:hypothetical protein
MALPQQYGRQRGWSRTKVSFALEGIEATDDDAERAGHMIAGHATCNQIQHELRDAYARQK